MPVLRCPGLTRNKWHSSGISLLFLCSVWSLLWFLISENVIFLTSVREKGGQKAEKEGSQLASKHGELVHLRKRSRNFWLGKTNREQRNDHLVNEGEGDVLPSSKEASKKHGIRGETLHYGKTNYSDGFPWEAVRAKDVDCSKLFAGDKGEQERIRNISRPVYADDDIVEDAHTCSRFIVKHGFITSTLTEEEKNFPLAYSLVVFKDPSQVLDLLKTIYRPQNFYCLHVDDRTSAAVRKVFEAMASCFDNVFMSSRSVRVHWGTFSVLEADLICMEDLWKHAEWKYYINLTGQEFPLKTNLEIVRILTVLNGANDVLVEAFKTHRVRWQKFLPAPHNLTIYKGSLHIAVSRPFVHYLLTNPVAKDFLNWTRPLYIPDEAFFNTLNHNPQLGIPGSYSGPHILLNLAHKPHLSRFKNWAFDRWPCADGRYVRQICVLTAGDLPLLDTRPELFANKFYQSYGPSHTAVECLAEKLHNRTRQQTLGSLSFDTTYYRNLGFLKHIVPATRKPGSV